MTDTTALRDLLEAVTHNEWVDDAWKAWHDALSPRNWKDPAEWARPERMR